MRYFDRYKLCSIGYGNIKDKFKKGAGRKGMETIVHREVKMLFHEKCKQIDRIIASQIF
jgi:hypothetical protein